jgi:hypothetical protein
MKKSIALNVAMLAFFAGAYQAQAAQVGLADWCVNVNSNISAACNGAGSGGGATGINLSSFDQTLENGLNSNTLGTVTVSLAAGSHEFVSFYADYDVSYNSFGSFDDSASIHGTTATGESYEVDDPNSSNIFNDFAGNSLNGKDNVKTPSGPPSNCCDVSFALAFGNLTVPAGGGTVTFSIAASAPSSGFYIEQTNQDTNNSIFLSGVFNGGVPPPPPPPPPGVPEPSTFGLGLSLIVAALAFTRRRAAYLMVRSVFLKGSI